jgi:hypothetical protein
MLTLALFYYMCWGCPKGRSIVGGARIFVGNTLARMKRLCCFRASAPRPIGLSRPYSPIYPTFGMLSDRIVPIGIKTSKYKTLSEQ